MLCDWTRPFLSEYALAVYREVVPANHYLRTVLEVVPWDDFDALLAPYYCAGKGRPAEPPVMMLKLEYLRESTKNHPPGERLAARVAQLKEPHSLQVRLPSRAPASA